MEGQKVEEFQDWEEVQLSSDSDLVNSPKSVRSLEEEDVSGGLIRLDHFSIEQDGLYVMDGVKSNDPCLGGDWLEDRKVGVFEVKKEMGFVEGVKGEVGFEGSGGIEGEDVGKGGKMESFREFRLKIEMGCEESLEREVRLERLDSKGDDLSKLWPKSGGDRLVLGDMSSENEDSVEGEGETVLEEENLGGVALAEETKQGAEEERKVVWWKVPFEMLKYCVFKARPVWSFSMAAAVVGFIILGRRMYKMKQKAKSLPLKVTVNDKKVSQVMSHAARLNEAFTMVRRVPVVRPLVPPAGVNPWPVMSLR